MTKITLSLLALLLIISCRVNNQIEQTNIDTNTTHSIPTEYSGVEPTKPEETELYTPVPPTVAPAKENAAPSDAIILFDGSNLDQWVGVNNKVAQWDINTAEGFFTVKNKSGNIQTKQVFGSIQLHIEWRSPAEVQGSGQSRANSGIFLQDKYEIQVLDNNDNDTYVNGQVASIYKQHIPLAKASAPTGEWNTYDAIYHAPEFNAAGKKTKSGTLTLLHNGILVQDHIEIKGTTPYVGWPKNEAHGKAPLKLQDHGDNSRVSYRNIWVREL